MERTYKYGKEVEGKICSLIVEKEYGGEMSNKSVENSDFEAYIDLFDAVRSEKDYDWMSDIFIPEFPSHMLTQSSIDVSQYFKTLNFVECYVMDESEQAQLASAAAEECLNRTLARRDLYHYQKYVRAKILNHLSGRVYLKCWWERGEISDVIGYELDEEGNENGNAPIYSNRVTKDQFNYGVIDPRNVFMDSQYTYSLQDKRWIIIRDNPTYDVLEAEKEQKGYFNLESVKKMLSASYKTDTDIDTEDQDNPQVDIDNTMNSRFDRLERHGLFWVTGGEDELKPGIDERGIPKESARLEKMVITTLKNSSGTILIGFNKEPNVDADGNPYYPIIRGLCYIHPTRDGGAGDAKYTKELQIGINDTFNLNNDRTRLATLPTMKAKKNVYEDTDSLFFAPEHVMEVNEMDDVQEFKIEDNIEGGLRQISMLKAAMEQADAIFPTTMGAIPSIASTTATAVAGAETRTNDRSNYKSLTFEYTALSDLYWMIQQMTWQYATPETGVKLMGELVRYFNPAYNFFYKPLSQSIEGDHTRDIKIQRLIQILGYVSQIPHPDTVKYMNYLIMRIATLMGDEEANIVGKLFNPNIPISTGEGEPIQVGGSASPEAPSNQYGVSQGSQQVMARTAANATSGYGV